MVLHGQGYSLDELAEWVELRKPNVARPDPIEVGRNVTFLTGLGKSGYRGVAKFNKAGGLA